MNKGAHFSDCKKYRYSLWRVWDDSKPLLGFCMLNPSTADETANDPTVERCQRRAKKMGYGGLIVMNVFAYRSTDPYTLQIVDDPVGWENDKYLLESARLCKMVICGWGKHGSWQGRGQKVRDLLKFWGVKTRALKINNDGSPAHPFLSKFIRTPSA